MRKPQLNDLAWSAGAAGATGSASSSSATWASTAAAATANRSADRCTVYCCRSGTEVAAGGWTSNICAARTWSGTVAASTGLWFYLCKILKTLMSLLNISEILSSCQNYRARLMLRVLVPVQDLDVHWEPIWWESIIEFSLILICFRFDGEYRLVLSTYNKSEKGE